MTPNSATIISLIITLTVSDTDNASACLILQRPPRPNRLNTEGLSDILAGADVTDQKFTYTKHFRSRG